MRRIIALSLLALAGFGCNPSPDEACDGYIAYRKENKLPADGDVRDKCMAAMIWVKEEAKGDAYQCASNGLARGKDGGQQVTHMESLVYGCSAQYGEVDDEVARGKWEKGINGDYDIMENKVRTAEAEPEARDWVPMTPQECADVALWALKKKIDDGAITDPDEGERYSDGILMDCQKVMNTEESGKYRCARLSISAADIDDCLD